ncbi:MAG: GxxExxY protein [Acidobacteriales bacterium]|nr:GxxExxY protein [Terriglobales bacterium]
MLRKHLDLPADLNELARVIVDAAFKVHKHLGPGLLESTYRLCLVHELRLRGLQVRQEVPLPIEYQGIKLDAGYRVDVLVVEKIILELKTVDALLAVHHAQILSYLKHSGKKLGFLINFNSVLLKDGIRRIVNTK